MNRQEIWDSVREETCHCVADSVGNCPCDYGSPCDKCHADWVQEIYQERLRENKYK